MNVAYPTEKISPTCQRRRRSQCRGLFPPQIGVLLRCRRDPARVRLHPSYPNDRLLIRPPKGVHVSHPTAGDKSRVKRCLDQCHRMHRAPTTGLQEEPGKPLQCSDMAPCSCTQLKSPPHPRSYVGELREMRSHAAAPASGHRSSQAPTDGTSPGVRLDSCHTRPHTGDATDVVYITQSPASVYTWGHFRVPHPVCHAALLQTAWAAFQLIDAGMDEAGEGSRWSVVSPALLLEMPQSRSWLSGRTRGSALRGHLCTGRWPRSESILVLLVSRGSGRRLLCWLSKW